MNKTILIILLLIILIALVSFLNTDIDRYAMEYAKIFGSYNIHLVDEYLNDDTKITYQGTTKTYKELRHNVVHSFEKQWFVMTNDSSYGSSHKVEGKTILGILSYVQIEDKSVENYIEMELERTGLTSYKVKSMSCNDDFFGRLFFGATY